LNNISKIKPKNYYKAIDHSIIPYDSDISITFRITESCNLHCEYCFWNSGKHYKIEDIKITIDKLFLYFENNNMKIINFYFHGGEASTHPDILEILDYIREKEKLSKNKIFIEFQTNLAMQLELLEDIIQKIDIIDISYHHNDLKKHNKFDNFIENWKYLEKIKFSIQSLDIMLENVQNINYFYNIILRLLKNENIVNSEMIYSFCHYDKNPETYTKHIEFYNKYNKTSQTYEIDGKMYNTNDLFEKGLDCTGWQCNAGINSIIVNGDGNVFKCGIHMTNYITRNIKEDKPYTNVITDKHFLIKLKILFLNGTICRWDYCGGDFYLSKEKK